MINVKFARFNFIKFYSALLSLCLLFIFSNCKGQENLNSIQSYLNEYYRGTIAEKIFVHTDKKFYLAGEVSWFKLYVVNAADNKPLDLSKVAYVEILDSGNKQILRAKIALFNGEGNGSFYIPVNLNSGNYRLRAYTNWMKNFDAAFYFEKNITVVNIQKGINSSSPNSEPRFDVQFFPEGGNLVNNIISKIAFKVTNEYGKGMECTGSLIDKTDTLLSFKSQHEGMGSFYISPLPGHVYKAYIKTATGQYLSKELPVAYPGGYVMSIKDSSDKLEVMVQSDVLSGHEVYLFIHSGVAVKLSTSKSLQDGKAIFQIDKTNLGDGINHITIFNELRQPVCERLFFNKPSKNLLLKIAADDQNYATRKNIGINLELGDHNDGNDSASLSMSVYRLDSLQSNDESAISSYLLLTSDLKGFVEDPGFYFSKDDDETRMAMDNLMLTNGWRRFKWENIFKNQKAFFEFVPEYNSAIVLAKIINTLTDKPANNIEAFISVPGFLPVFSTSNSDNNGLVKFELKNVYGNASMVMQTNTSRDSVYRFDYIDPFSYTYSQKVMPQFILEKDKANSLRQESISMQVQNIYSAKNLKNFNIPTIDSTPFYDIPDAAYLVDNYTRFTTIEEILREYVTLVDVRKREGRFHFEVFDNATHTLFNGDPLVLLDGTPVIDFNKFALVDPLKLKKLDVVNRRYFIGNSMFNGILSWTSFKSDMADYDQGTHATIIDYEGLQIEREFYSPAYATEAAQSSHIPDFRNVLFWSAHLRVGSSSSSKVNFYSSDLPGKYLVCVQGISRDGKPVMATTTFTVSHPSK